MKPIRKENKGRKRTLAQGDRSPVSTQLREALDFIQRREYAEGLQALDEISSNDPIVQVKLLCAVAVSENRRGDLSAAMSVYERAEAVVQHPRSWFAPAIGQVAILLKELRAEEALQKADAILSNAIRLENEHAVALNRAANGFTSYGRPYRTSVIATRLGNTFLREGYLKEAQDFFLRALASNPDGASRARIGLAEIAFRYQEFSQAEKRAMEAIFFGKYQAKTLPALEWLLKATAAQSALMDCELILEDYRAGKGSIYDRAVHLVITQLRQQANLDWQPIAMRWLAQSGERDPVVEAEVRKLILTNLRLRKAPLNERIQAAEALLAVRKLVFCEWVFAAKEKLEASLELGQKNISDDLLSACDARFGAKRRADIRHRLARTARECGHVDLARALYQEARLLARPGDAVWGMATWSLARIFDKEKKPDQAADIYYSIYNHAQGPLRFRLLALVAWARSLLRAGRASEILGKQREFLTAVHQISDYELVLDMAWQLVEAPRELNSLALEILTRGKKLALEAAASAHDPSAARAAYFILTRRLADFRKDAEIIEIWEKLSSEKREWLWAEEARFWEYVGYVFYSYRKLGNNGEAHALAKTYLDEPATPPAGIAELGIQDGLLRIQEGDRRGAFERFEKVLKAAPNYSMSGHAHYWQALRHHKAGDKNACSQAAARIALCTGNTPGLYWQKSLRRRGLLLECHLDADKVIQLLGEKETEAVRDSLERISKDLDKI